MVARPWRLLAFLLITQVTLAKPAKLLDDQIRHLRLRRWWQIVRVAFSLKKQNKNQTYVLIPAFFVVFNLLVINQGEMKEK